MYLASVFEDMERSIRTLLREEGVATNRVRIVREIAVCYVGQSYQLNIEVPETIDSETWAIMTQAFHQRHEAAYGFANRREPVQFVNLRLTAIGQVDRPTVRRLERATDAASRALKRPRDVYFGKVGGMIRSEVYDRALLLAGDTFSGPAIVEQMDCTTVIPPGAAVTVDAYGSLLVSVFGATSSPAEEAGSADGERFSAHIRLARGCPMTLPPMPRTAQRPGQRWTP